MNEEQKIKFAVSQGRIKLHLFKPSKRKIWTAVGESTEYWLEPDLNFCSCKGYYFNKLDRYGTCYHLKSAKIAKLNNKIELIEFTDFEYDDFLSCLIYDLNGDVFK